MTPWRLVIRELRYRKLNFAMAVLAVTAVVGCVVATVTLLRSHDIHTDSILAAKSAEIEAEVHRRQAEADKRASELNEAYRKIMLKFGYNLLILPKAEGIVDYLVRGEPSRYMDERNVDTLANSGIMTVRHLLGVLQQRQILFFGDRRQEVFLVGTRGEVPLSHRSGKKPLLAAVAPGEMIVGHDIHRELGVEVGETVRVKDKSFRVVKVYDARGTNDDCSVWIDLKQAQQLLGKPGRISGILALNCLCTKAKIDDAKRQIERILPDTRVRVMVSNATIRYESRMRAAEEAEAQVAAARRQGVADIERQTRARAGMKRRFENFAEWAAPLILIGSAAWLILLTMSNVRRRRSEIGILLALGLRRRQIFAVFQIKSLIVGSLGAIAGYIAGFAVVWCRPDSPAGTEIFSPYLPIAVLLAAPALSVLAGWAPAMIAARQDPAEVLREQ